MLFSLELKQNIFTVINESLLADYKRDAIGGEQRARTLVGGGLKKDAYAVRTRWARGRHVSSFHEHVIYMNLSVGST